MKTRLDRLSIAALLAIGATAAHAQSKVTLYGIAAVELVHATGVADASGIGTRNYLDNSQVTSSRIGFKGSEDLGDGLAAIFGLESGIALDTGGASTSFWGRGAYVGLSSPKLGTLTFGRQWNVNDDIMANYFVFDGYSAFRWTEFFYISELVDNAVKYVSPDFGGFTARALFAPGEGVTGRTAEIAANYEIVGLNVGASYRHAKGLNGEADKLTTGGVSYTFASFRPHVGYSVSDMKATGNPKAKAWDVGLQYAPTPQWTFDFDWVERDQVDSDNDSHFWRIQAAYYLSKRTSFILNLVDLKNKGVASERFYGDGAAGQDQSVFSFGMRHSF